MSAFFWNIDFFRTPRLSCVCAGIWLFFSFGETAFLLLIRLIKYRYFLFHFWKTQKQKILPCPRFNFAKFMTLKWNAVYYSRRHCVYCAREYYTTKYEAVCSRNISKVLRKRFVRTGYDNNACESTRFRGGATKIRLFENASFFVWTK